MKRLRLLLFMCIVASCPRSAGAQAFSNGTLQTLYASPAFCPDNIAVMQAYTGYFANAAAQSPKTGDIAYIQAVGAVPGPCVGDTVGFEFFLPDGAALAISAINPVLCYKGTLGTNVLTPLANTGTSSCSQTPSTGVHFNGLFFSYSVLQPGEYLLVKVPVVFNKQLLGAAGPITHRLTVAANSVYGSVAPFQPVTVFYQATFQSLASSGLTSSSANLSFTLASYFRAGTLFVDYGTTNAFGSSLTGSAVANTAMAYTSNASLTGLNASTTYFWRARYVTTDGTFTSATQSFTTTSGGGTTKLLTLTMSGAGTVTSSPAGLSCTASCTTSFTTNTVVTLTASAAAGSVFAGWSGGLCTGAGTCVTTMSAARSVTATFTRAIGSLAVTVAGLPSGSSVVLEVTGPDGYAATRTVITGAGFTLTDVPTGAAAVSAPEATMNGSTYGPNSASQQATITAGTTQTINVVYGLTAAVTPANVTATASTPTSVSITWTAVAGATYEVTRVAAGGVSSIVGSTASGSLTDAAATANTAYLYKVRAVAPNTTAYSGPDLATTTIFTDPSLVAGTTVVKMAHFTELRTAVNAVRALAGLTAGAYADATLSPGVTRIKAAHVIDLRTALDAARSALQLPAVTYTRPSLTIGTTFIAAADINDLRGGVR